MPRSVLFGMTFGSGRPATAARLRRRTSQISNALNSSARRRVGRKKIMLGKILRRRIKHGRLTIIRPDGHTEQFGELTAAKPRPDVAVRLKGALTSLKLSLHPDLYFGELYVDGALIIERGTLWDLLELLGRNQLEQRSVPGNSVIGPLQAFLRWMRRGDSRRAARRHVAHHYDLPHEHYRRFLDADLQYSCP